MTEQFSFEDGTSNEKVLLSDFEKAFGDTVIQDATQEAKERAMKLDMSGSMLDIEMRTEKDVNELNNKVWHAIDTTAKITGIVSTFYGSDGIASRSLSTDDVPVDFKGFVSRYDYEAGVVHYDYAFTAAYNPQKDQLLSSENINEVIENDEMSDFVEIVISAKPEEVFVEYDVIHPVRAQAWLELSYPHTLREIDERIIYGVNTSEERSLLGLRGFSLDLSKLDDRSEIERYVGSVAQYVRGMITVDTQVPYIIDIDGECLDYAIPGTGWAEMRETNARYSVESICLFSRNDIDNDKLYQFAFMGILHNADVNMPSKAAFVPLDSVGSLESLRSPVIYEEE